MFCFWMYSEYNPNLIFKNRFKYFLILRYAKPKTQKQWAQTEDSWERLPHAFPLLILDNIRSLNNMGRYLERLMLFWLKRFTSVESLLLHHKDIQRPPWAQQLRMGVCRRGQSTCCITSRRRSRGLGNWTNRRGYHAVRSFNHSSHKTAFILGNEVKVCAKRHWWSTESNWNPPRGRQAFP